jgi:hypothetical protein
LMLYELFEVYNPELKHSNFICLSRQFYSCRGVDCIISYPVLEGIFPLLQGCGSHLEANHSSSPDFFSD